MLGGGPEKVAIRPSRERATMYLSLEEIHSAPDEYKYSHVEKTGGLSVWLFIKGPDPRIQIENHEVSFSELPLGSKVSIG